MPHRPILSRPAVPHPGPAPSATTFAMLGKYLSLALMLPAGAFAGFLLGRFAEHWIHASWPTLAGIVLGVIASVMKVFDELMRDVRREELERSPERLGATERNHPPNMP